MVVELERVKGVKLKTTYTALNALHNDELVDRLTVFMTKKKREEGSIQAPRQADPHHMRTWCCPSGFWAQKTR